MILPGSVRADAPSWVMVKNGEAVPANKPGSSSGETVYLASEVTLHSHPTLTAKLTPTPTPQSNISSVPVPPAKAQADAPITVSKPSHQTRVTNSKMVTKASSNDAWEDEYTNAGRIADPIQPVNRGIFWFNHQLYEYVFIPLNKTYKFVFPHPIRRGISNAIDNIEYPVRFVNDLLQWKPGRAGFETEKFLINSTVGIAGLIKVSDKIPSLANVKSTDTSATFAKWGIPPGCYIVWPVIGPKSLLNTFGFAGDLALNPATWFTCGVVGGLTGTTTLAISAPQTVGNTSDRMDSYDTVTKSSVDRYLSVRSAYVQYRKKVESQ